MRSAFSRLDEKEEGRIFQPYRQSRADAQVRAKIPGGVSAVGARTDAHGARNRRGLHERYSPPVSFARRPADLVVARRLDPLRPAAAPRLREADGGARDEGPGPRNNPARRFG